VLQAATKWKRVALKQFGMDIGEGLYTDMHAVRKDYVLDHDHSAYVDQWDWEIAITDKERNLQYLKEVIEKIWKVLKGAEVHVQGLFLQLKTDKYPDMPEKLTLLHAENILDMQQLEMTGQLGQELSISLTSSPRAGLLLSR